MYKRCLCIVTFNGINVTILLPIFQAEPSGVVVLNGRSSRVIRQPHTLLFGSFKFALCLGQLPPQIFDLSGQLLDVLVAVYEIRCLPYAHFRRDFYFFLMN